MIKMKTSAEWESDGCYVIPNAPIAAYNRYGTALYASDWVRIDEDMPW
jgi:hypothetical protein